MRGKRRQRGRPQGGSTRGSVPPRSCCLAVCVVDVATSCRCLVRQVAPSYLPTYAFAAVQIYLGTYCT